MNKNLLLASGGIFLLFSMGMIFFAPEAFAQSNTTVYQIDGEIALEKTEIAMNVPSDNLLSWGFIEGKIENPAANYPVTIQISQDDELVHIAQVNVDSDGSYEYKFRVKTIDGDKTVQIFEGDYTVNVYKVVYSDLESV